MAVVGFMTASASCHEHSNTAVTLILDHALHDQNKARHLFLHTHQVAFKSGL